MSEAGASKRERTALVFADQHGVEAGFAVAGDRNLDMALSGQDTLAGGAVGVVLAGADGTLLCQMVFKLGGRPDASRRKGRGRTAVHLSYRCGLSQMPPPVTGLHHDPSHKIPDRLHGRDDAAPGPLCLTAAFYFPVTLLHTLHER